jgi:hypothetical protein
MFIKRAGDIFQMTSLQKSSTITASGSGQFWYNIDLNFVKFSTPNGEKIL